MVLAVVRTHTKYNFVIFLNHRTTNKWTVEKSKIYCFSIIACEPTTISNAHTQQVKKKYRTCKCGREIKTDRLLPTTPSVPLSISFSLALSVFSNMRCALSAQSVWPIVTHNLSNDSTLLFFLCDYRLHFLV